MVGAEGLGSVMPMDIVEAKESYFIAVDLPGVEKQDTRIEIKDDVLTISAERKQSTILPTAAPVNVANQNEGEVSVGGEAGEKHEEEGRRGGLAGTQGLCGLRGPGCAQRAAPPLHHQVRRIPFDFQYGMACILCRCEEVGNVPEQSGLLDEFDLHTHGPQRLGGFRTGSASGVCGH